MPHASPLDHVLIVSFLAARWHVADLPVKTVELAERDMALREALRDLVFRQEIWLMAEDDGFDLWLGRIGKDRLTRHRLIASARRAGSVAARASRGRFTGERIGRGAGMARVLLSSGRFSGLRDRRVVVNRVRAFPRRVRSQVEKKGGGIQISCHPEEDDKLRRSHRWMR